MLSMPAGGPCLRVVWQTQNDARLRRRSYLDPQDRHAAEEDVDKNEYRGSARAILALVYKTLSEPTEAMVEAWEKSEPPPLASLNPFSPTAAADINRGFATSDLRAMLNASPLNGEE